MTQSEQPLLRLQPEEYSRQRDHHDLGGGYTLRAVNGDFAVSWRALDADRHGARVVRVASVQRHPVALQEVDFLPGQPVELRHDPHDPDDPTAISVWNGAGETLVGHVSRQDLYDVRRLMFGGEPIQAMVVWDWRSEGGMRKGLNLLVAREGVVQGLEAPARRYEAPQRSRGISHPAPALGFAAMALLVFAGVLGSLEVLLGGIVAVGTVAYVLHRRAARADAA